MTFANDTETKYNVSEIPGINSTNYEIYDLKKLQIKWSVLPDYVKKARNDALQDNPNYDKIVLDKWGRKDVNTNLYVEVPEMVFFRAAHTIARGLVDHDPNLDYETTVRQAFEKMVRREIFPNTPYMANAGHEYIANFYKEKILDKYGIDNAATLHDLLVELEYEKRQKPQLFACFVLELYDSKKSIFETMSDAADIQKLIGGTGFNFSYLRPANEAIRGSGGITDGPVSFMAMYSTVLGKTMNQGGKREGANMFMLNTNHPDSIRFIYSKRKDGEIPAANISVAADHEFMNAYLAEDLEKSFYPLENPHYNPKLRPDVPKYYTVYQLKKSILNAEIMNKKAQPSLLLDKDGVAILSPFIFDIKDGNGNPILTEDDLKIGKVREDGIVYLNAKKVMKHISACAWANGEPGFIFTGHINDENPTHPRHYIEYLKERNSRRSLDEILEEVKERDEEGKYINLPIGVGEIRATNPCGEKPLLPFEACVLGHVNFELILDKDVNSESGYVINRDKLRENTRWMYEILDNAIDQNYFTHPMIEKTQKSNRKIGLGFMGLANMLMKLEIPYNSQEARDLVADIWGGEVAKYSDQLSHEKAEKFREFDNFKYSSLRLGLIMRNAIRRTLAPTGTTGFVAKTTGGCEPEYALTYTRTTVQGTEIKLLNPVLEEKLEKYNIFYDENEKQEFMDFISDPKRGAGSLKKWEVKIKDNENIESFNTRVANFNKLKRFIVTTYDISPEDHIRMQAVVQNYTDDAISKTTNFRANATLDDIENAYKLAYQLETKGTTFYRDGTRKGQPLEVKDGKKISEGGLEVSLNGKGGPIFAKRPEIVVGIDEKSRTPYEKPLFVTLGLDFSTNTRYETFINVGEAGSDLKAINEGFGKLISLALQYGVPLEEVITKLKGIKGETQAGIGPEKVSSLPDAISKALEKAEKKAEMVFGRAKYPSELSNNDKRMSSNLCKCGKPLILVENCEKCSDINCGYFKC